MSWLSWSRSAGVTVSLAAGLAVVVAVLAWIGLTASREWQRSATVLVQRRGDEAARLLVTALMRDMRAAETVLRTSPVWDEFTVDAPFDVVTLVATAFARYPYPEAFFAWNGGTPAASLTFFLRSGRPPTWTPPFEERARYPVRTATHPQVAAAILARAAPSALQSRELSVTDLDIGGIPYQVVMRLRYRDRLREELAAVYGFIVNLQFVREHYLPEMTRQVARIGGEDTSLALGILDDGGSEIVSTRAFVDDAVVSERQFPLTFFDPVAVALNPPPDLPQRMWTVRASAAADPTLAGAIRGSQRMLLLTAFCAIVLGLGLLLSVNAVRTNASLASLRADFVSSVTHELKTPLASIQALAGALLAGRVPSPDGQREYAGLVLQEAKRLSRLVDNVLAHARLTDVADVYSFEALDVVQLIHKALAVFQLHLRQGGFAVRIDLPASVPRVRADRSALELVFANLIDNAIRYSSGRKALRVTVTAGEHSVRIEVADRGIGISREDLGRITHRFVRGRNAIAAGSGLGLAIVRRVIDDHGGQLAIESALNEGTSVVVTLPCAPDETAQATSCDMAASAVSISMTSPTRS
jgi:signal transduction histidine kinase